MSRFVAIIPAGGSGTRLWPLSRAHHPKFLIPLIDESSMLQHTWRRLEPICDDIIIVAGAEHADEIQAQLPELNPANLLIEPSAKNTLPAVAWAAALAYERDPDVVIGSFAADHFINNDKSFSETVTLARQATQNFPLVTIGITAQSAATSFGYIDLGRQHSSTVFSINRFTEKPSVDLAQKFFDGGNHLWNAGMFFAEAKTLLHRLHDLQPHVFDAIQTLMNQKDEHLWISLDPIAIDHGLAEPMSLTNDVAVVKADFDWSDVGDFASLPKIRKSDPFFSVNSSGFVSTTKPVAIVGINDAVVVETHDVILVTTKDHAQQVGKIIEQLPQDLR